MAMMEIRIAVAMVRFAEGLLLFPSPSPSLCPGPCPCPGPGPVLVAGLLLVDVACDDRSELMGGNDEDDCGGIGSMEYDGNDLG